MSKTLKDLMAAATHRRWSTEDRMNAWLTEQGIDDPETRIAAKHFFESTGRYSPGRGPTISAQTGLATEQVRDDGLATDRARYTPVSPQPTYRPGMSRVERLLQSMGVTSPVTLAELERRMTAAELDVETRISCKLEAQQHNLIKG
jgi:hypothetical protein